MTSRIAQAVVRGPVYIAFPEAQRIAVITGRHMRMEVCRAEDCSVERLHFIIRFAPEPALGPLTVPRPDVRDAAASGTPTEAQTLTSAATGRSGESVAAAPEHPMNVFTAFATLVRIAAQPEPTGDVMVVDENGSTWVPTDAPGIFCNVRAGVRYRWQDVVDLHGPVKVYEARP